MIQRFPINDMTYNPVAAMAVIMSCVLLDSRPLEMCALSVCGRYGPIRLGAIAAKSGRANELIYHHPTAIQENTAPVLVFFGGDVQDYPEDMAAHRDHRKYKEWSLTETASILSSKFPQHQILIVRPSRMERKTFSCFDNFVESNSVGAPSHEPGKSALMHLNDLILEGLKSAATKQETNATISSEYEDITLIGFSKGCVVLNQLITEFHSVKTYVELKMTKTLEDTLGKMPSIIMSKISNMYWLDGGHAGGSKTWITDSQILKTLASLEHIQIHVHVTPYQVEDYQRPWIKQECKSFSKQLQRFGRKISYKLHFQEVEPSLLAHFRLLNEFA